MHFQMKIQPIDNQNYEESLNNETAPTVKPVLKSRLKRLFDRSVLKNNSETNGAGEVRETDFEPSSVCLAKMVQNFIEDSAPEKPKCGRNRCNCFNGNINDISDDEFDPSAAGFFGDSSETLKSLAPCCTVIQRNLLADVSKIVDMYKTSIRKDELRKIVAEQLQIIGYDASVCKSRWEKSSSYPAGEYEYLDVINEGGGDKRILIDIDFRSELEIARPTGNYKAILQSLPSIFVGDADRLQQILLIVSEAAKLSLKKKGMHVPPWRKYEYMTSKWLSAHVRTSRLTLPPPPPTPPPTPDANTASKQVFSEFEPESGVFELEETVPLQLTVTVRKSGDGFESSSAGTWQPPAVKPRGSKSVVTGLASLFK